MYYTRPFPCLHFPAIVAKTAMILLHRAEEPALKNKDFGTNHFVSQAEAFFLQGLYG
jgi:hypothetical protein